MYKKQILEILKEMLADYESALIWVHDDIDVDHEFEYFDRFLEKKHIDFGFCNWLKKSIFTVFNQNLVLNELRLDYDGTTIKNGYWYRTPINFFIVQNAKDESLMPRAQHLKQTIERLESELK